MDFLLFWEHSHTSTFSRKTNNSKKPKRNSKKDFNTKLVATTNSSISESLTTVSTKKSKPPKLHATLVPARPLKSHGAQIILSFWQTDGKLTKTKATLKMIKLTFHFMDTWEAAVTESTEKFILWASVITWSRKSSPSMTLAPNIKRRIKKKTKSQRPRAKLRMSKKSKTRRKMSRKHQLRR